MRRTLGSSVVVLAVLAAVTLAAAPAGADHSWGSLHWERSANSPVSLDIGDNVSGSWDSHLAVAISDWDASSVLDLQEVSGGSNPSICQATFGRVEVCNSSYGANGWLGIASVWTSGGHIVQATVKLNDTYFNTSFYNTPAWRQTVTCQEIGHVFGLSHVDENFTNANLGTCMDYTDRPESNQHPNAHDYDQLAAIYAHDHGGTTPPPPDDGGDGGTGGDGPGNGKGNGKGKGGGNGKGKGKKSGTDSSAWGRSIRFANNGDAIGFVQDLGRGDQLYTFVVWAN